MTTLPEEAVKAAVEAVDEGVNWVAGLFGEKYDNAEEVMRAALTAALPFLPVQVAVKEVIADYVEKFPLAKLVGDWPHEHDADAAFDTGARAQRLTVAQAIRDMELTISEPSAAACPCTKVQQDETCPVGYPSLLCEICNGKGLVQPSAARELALERISKILRGDVETDTIVTAVNRLNAAIDIALRTLSSPDHDDAGKVEGDGIERAKFYHHQWPMEKLLEARRDGLVDRSGGEAWRYEYSHKDEHGKYDILYRPLKNSSIRARLPSAPSEGAE